MKSLTEYITSCYAWNLYFESFFHFCIVYILDLYQITMAYAYWKSEKVGDMAVFDLFFRKSPFQGEFTIFAGLDECLKFLENFRYSDSGECLLGINIILKIFN